MNSDWYAARQKWLWMGVASLVAASAMFCVVGCTPPEEKTPSSAKATEPRGDNEPSPEELLDWIKNVDRSNMSAEDRKLLEEAEKHLEKFYEEMATGLGEAAEVYREVNSKKAK